MSDPRFAEHLATFVDVVRRGSFSAAARQRALTPSAIVRQVDALEASLGTPLLERSTRGLKPTDAGLHLLERGRRLLDDLADLRNELAALDGSVSGTLRVACFPTFGKRHVVPVVTELLKRHPDLRVELSFDERPAQPVTERFDVLVRIGPLDDSGLFGIRLAAQRRLLVATPDYMAAAPPLGRLADLARHNLLEGYDRSGFLGWSELVGGDARDGAEPRYRSNDYEALRGAALAGVGVALLPDWVVGPDVRDGHLTSLEPTDDAGLPWRDAEVPITLLRATRRAPGKVRVLIDLLRETIGTPPCWSS